MGEIRVKTADGWSTKPAHKKTSTGWQDIPTHTMTANGWQGELTSQSPLRFRADGEMLDWRVEGKTSENLFDIGASATDYTSPSYTNLTISNDTLSMELSSESGMTYAIRTQRQTRKGAVTFAFDTDCNTGIGIIVKIRDNDDTRWLMSSDTSISGFTYNNVYSGWYKWTPLNNGHPIQAITIPNVGSYYYVGFIFAHSSSAVGNVYSATNIRLLEGTYTTSTIPPYEPYGGVGNWDETEQKYRIPVRVEGENLYTIELGDDRWGTLANSQIISRTDGVLQIEMTSERNSGVYALSASAIMQLSDIRSTVSYSFDIRADTDISVLVGYEVQGARAILQVSDEWVTVKFENILFTQSYSFTIVNRSSGGTVYVRNFMFKEGTTTNLYTDHQLMDGDSIDYTTTETTIPLTTGNNILTVDTAVKPSKVFVKFEG